MARVRTMADPEGEEIAPKGARERIRDTAEQWFAREGVTAVTLRPIAAAQPVRRSSRDRAC